MSPKDFSEIVKALLSIMVVLTFVYGFIIEPDAYKDLIIQALSIILGYWLGSSSGSAKKDDRLAEGKP
jgi:hypothetical protein